MISAGEMTRALSGVFTEHEMMLPFSWGLQSCQDLYVELLLAVFVIKWPASKCHSPTGDGDEMERQVSAY